MSAAAVFEGPFAIVAAVLVISGAMKLADPTPTTAMLRALKLPSATGAVYAVAVVEIIAGVSGIVLGGRVAALAVALLYLAFAAVSLRLLALGDSVDCGCFGRSSAPMTGIHVAVNIGCAVVAAVAAVLAVPSLLDLRPELPWAGLPQVGYVALGAGIVVALLTVLPETLAAGKSDRRGVTVPVEFSITRRPGEPR